KTALEEDIPNVAFLRIQIDHIDQFFAPGEVKDIWITFPDPFLRKSKARKRLTHLRFLHLYKKILQLDGHIRLKTDSPELYDFTHESVLKSGCLLHRDIPDVYASNPDDILNIKTYYEGLHLEDGRI